MNLLPEILQRSYQVLAEAAPYILFGTAMAGVVHALIASERIPRLLSGRTVGSVFRATLIGIPLPLCSCSVLPVAMELRKRGASKGATSAFLVSTPETGVDSIALSWGLLNPIFAVSRVIGAFLTAAAAGIAQNFADRGGDEQAVPVAEVKSCCASKQPEPAHSCCGGENAMHSHDESKLGFGKRLLAGQKYAFGDLLPGMAGYYIIGLFATGVVLAVLPDGWLENYVGGGFLGRCLVAIMGMVVYICASAATPMAAALVAKGMSPGTALTMMLAGPATSLASMTSVRAMLGTRGLAINLSAIFVCAVGAGLALDFFYAATAIPLVIAAASDAHHQHVMGVSLFGHVASIIVLGIFLLEGRKLIRRHRSGHDGMAAAQVRDEPVK